MTTNDYNPTEGNQFLVKNLSLKMTTRMTTKGVFNEYRLY